MTTSTYSYEALLPDCSLRILRNTATIRKLPRSRRLISWLAVNTTNTERLDGGFPDHMHLLQENS